MAEASHLDYRADRSRREADLTRFYEQQAADRSGFPTPQVRNQHRDMFLDRLEATFTGTTPIRMLEIGTGAGRDAADIAVRGFALTGIDLATANLRYTRGDAQVTQASAVQLPFATHSFEAVMSFSTLMHISDADVDLALTEIRRVLTPGGMAAFGTWGADADGDKVIVNDHYEPARYFALRTDATWRAMIAEHAEVIELSTWRVDGVDDHYQWVEARFG